MFDQLHQRMRNKLSKHVFGPVTVVIHDGESGGAQHLGPRHSRIGEPAQAHIIRLMEPDLEAMV